MSYCASTQIVLDATKSFGDSVFKHLPSSLAWCSFFIKGSETLKNVIDFFAGENVSVVLFCTIFCPYCTCPVKLISFTRLISIDKRCDFIDPCFRGGNYQVV